MSCSTSAPGKEVEALEDSVISQGNPLKWEESIGKLRSRFSLKPGQPAILISISEQKLYLVKDERIVRVYPVSTSKYGTGNIKGSNKTPLGTHRISESIGKDAEIGTIFESRINTGKIAKIYTDSTDTPGDLITSRIMWLEGLETGINRGKGIDSHERRIYIHGIPEEGLIGKPASQGCVRMKNRDVIELFDLVPKGTLVEIQQ